MSLLFLRMPLTVFIAPVTFPFAAIFVISVDLTGNPPERLVVGYWIGVDAFRPLFAYMVESKITFFILMELIEEIAFPFGGHEGIVCEQW